MSERTVEFETILTHALELTPLEKIELVEQIMATLKQDMPVPEKKPRRSLRGLWADLDIDISAEEIDEARREMWSGFPREDVA